MPQSPLEALKKATSIGPANRKPEDALRSATTIGAGSPLDREIPIQTPEAKLRGLIAGLGDLGNVEAGPAKAVTMFLKGGVPDVAAREWFTSATAERAKRIYPEHVGPAIEQFTTKYPRVSAHMKLSEYPGMEAEATTNWARPIPNEPLGFPGSRFGVSIRPSAVADAASPDLLVHEATHVAQRLGNKQAPELYRLVDEGLKKHPDISTGSSGFPSKPEQVAASAYLTNPFEKSARHVSMRKTGKLDSKRVSPVSEQVEQWLRKDPNNSELAAIKNIFDQRKGLTAPSAPVQGLKQASEVKPASRPLGELRRRINDGEIRMNLDTGATPQLPSASGAVKPTGRSHVTGGNAKIRPEAVRYIRELAAAGQPIEELASKFSLSRESVRQIVTREAWSRIK